MLAGIRRSFFRNSFGLKTSKHVSKNTFVKDPFIYGCAVLAKSVIDKITQETNLENLKKKSLTEEIIDEIDKHDHVCEQAKNEIKALFTTGINIKKQQSFFSQSRITDAGINAKQSKRKIKGNVFVFHPSNLVTGQIFSHLYDSPNSKVILSGHKGISKTVSIFLFWRLAKYIDAYRFIDGENVEDEFYDVPKMVYWTVKKKDNIKSVRKNILNQCQQVKNQVSERLFEKNQETLESHYDRYSQRLRLCIIIDQINTIASLYRKYLQENGLAHLQLEKLRFHKITDPVLAKFQEMLQNILPSFHGIINLSSMSIEPIFSAIFDLSAQGKHSLAKMKFVQYPSEIYKEQNMYGLVDHFLFQYEQRGLRINGFQTFDHEMRRQIRDKCVYYLKAQIFKYYFTPLNIYEWIVLKTTDIKTKYNSMTKEEKIQSVVSNFKLFVNQTTEQFKKTIKSGFLKNDKNDLKRRIILFYIYNKLKLIVDQQKQLNEKQIPSEVSEVISMDDCILQAQTVAEFINKTLFQFDRKNVYFLVPAALIFQGMKEQIPEMAKYYVETNDKLILNFTKMTVGRLAQYLFIKALVDGKMNLKLYSQTPDKNSESNWILSIPKISQNIYLFKSLNPFTPTKSPEEKYQQKTNQSQKVIQKNQNDSDGATASQKSVETFDSKGITNASPFPFGLSQSQWDRLVRKKEIIEKLEPHTKIRRGKKFKFLQSLIPRIQQMIHNKQESALFLPTRQKANENKILKTLPPQDDEIVDHFSMVIDLILVIISQDPARNKSITIVVSDLTVGTEVYQKYEKIIQQFIGFEDRAQTEIIIGGDSEKNQKTIPINLYYYVLGTQPFQGNLVKEFNQTFGKFIKFGPQKRNKLACQVQELDGHKNSLLKTIGYLDLRNVVFENEAQQDVLLFKQVVQKAIKYYENKKKQQQK